MNFDLTDSQKEMKKNLGQWLNQEWGDFFPSPQGEIIGLREMTRTFLQKLGRTGYYLETGLNPKLSSQSPFSEALSGVSLAEELARFSPSLCLSLEQSTRLFGWLISRYGTDRQREELLLPLQQGTILGAVALSESLGNFPEKEMKTQGQKQGDGTRVTGRKMQVINAPLADWLAVPARVEDQWAIFFIKPDQEGLSIGSPQKTLGLNAITLADIILNHCLVPEDRIMGPFAEPTPLVELQIRSNLITSTVSLGIMDRTFQEAKKIAAESREGSKPPRAYQEISFKLAEMFTLLQTSQWMLYRAAWMLEANVSGASTVAAAAKVFVTEAAETVAREAMQVLAGEGYLAGNRVEEGYRDARFGPVAGETSEVLRMRIADECLARYR